MDKIECCRSNVVVIEDNFEYYDDVTKLLSESERFNVLPLGLSNSNGGRFSPEEHKKSILTRFDNLIADSQKIDLIISDLRLRPEEDSERTGNFLSVSVVNEILDNHPSSKVVINSGSYFKDEDFYKISGVKQNWIFLPKPELRNSIPFRGKCPDPKRCNFRFDDCRDNFCYLQRINFFMNDIQVR